MTVEIERSWGGMLVRARDSVGTEHRFWFDETDQGRVVLCAYIVYIEETDYRDYIPQDEWSVPDEVRGALMEEGLDAEYIFDTDGWTVD